MRITTRFTGITRQATKTGNCPVCGKRSIRKTTFMQTLNPYNKNAQGNPKSVREIEIELAAEAKNWEPDFTHQKCYSE